MEDLKQRYGVACPDVDELLTRCGNSVDEAVVAYVTAMLFQVLRTENDKKTLRDRVLKLEEVLTAFSLKVDRLLPCLSKAIDSAKIRQFKKPS